MTGWTRLSGAHVQDGTVPGNGLYPTAAANAGIAAATATTDTDVLVTRGSLSFLS